MELLLTGLSHKTAPIELREQLALPAEEVPRALQGLLQGAPGLKEAVLLSTCNRVELYGIGDERAHDRLDGFFKFMERTAPVESALYKKRGAEAIRHLFSVASGLDSMVVGESEVLGQVRQAYQAARESGTTGKFTNVFFQRALFLGKKVRTETGISRGATSVASVGVSLAQRIFGDLSRTRVLILGAGEVAETTARHLLSQKAGSLVVINRTHEKAVELARLFRGQAARFDALKEEMALADIVICSTGSASPLVRRETVESVMPRRRGRSLYFVDVAVPRDVEPGVHALDNVYVYDIDDLQGLVAENLAHRTRDLAQAQAMIEEAAREFSAWHAAVREGREATLRHAVASPKPYSSSDFRQR